MKTGQIKRNEECIVRDRPCGRIFGGSNTCFVASPSPEIVGYELDIIRTALEKEEIEPYIAVENVDPGKDIFCTKICTKIIESKLCVVVLTGETKSKKVLPNPNVYYEYGLMTA